MSLTIHIDDAAKTLRILSIVIIILSTITFWQEATRRYKILFPFKKNKYDSKQEQQIAEYFKRKDIIFEHHPRLKIPKTLWVFDIPFSKINIEPDFYLPEFDIYVEFWGRIDDPEYKKNSYDRKKKAYEDNSINFLSIYPKNLNNLDFVFTSKLLEVIKKRNGDQRNHR